MHACSFTPNLATPQPAGSAAEFVTIYGATTNAEIQRLRINFIGRVFCHLRWGIDYVQYTPEPSPPALYCEAQSAESWPALAAVLIPERVAHLRTAGYSDPGRAPNYWKSYIQQIRRCGDRQRNSDDPVSRVRL